MKSPRCCPTRASSLNHDPACRYSHKKRNRDRPRREVRVAIRLTREELAALQERADAYAKGNLSVLLRDAALAWRRS